MEVLSSIKLELIIVVGTTISSKSLFIYFNLIIRLQVLIFAFLFKFCIHDQKLFVFFSHELSPCHLDVQPKLTWIVIVFFYTSKNFKRTMHPRKKIIIMNSWLIPYLVSQSAQKLVSLRVCCKQTFQSKEEKLPNCCWPASRSS